MEKHDKVRDDFVRYIMLMPLIGLAISCFFALFLFIRNKVWSWYTIVYTLLPIVIILLLFFILIGLIKLKYNCNIIKKWNKIHKVLMLLLSVILIAINIILWKYKSINFNNLSLQESIEIVNETNGVPYFIIYGSNNCIYCYQMEEIYKQAVLDISPEYIYYVDLSYETVNQELIQKRNIDSLPLMVLYKNGKEIKRLEGLSKLNAVKEFLQNTNK